MIRNKLVLFALLLALALTATACTALPIQEAKTVELQFMDHLTAGFTDQDVFIESEESPDQVMRIDVDMKGDEAMLAKPLYASTEYAEHDEFHLSDAPLGPFAKGEPLGFTAADWYSASGSGTYTIEGSQARVDFTFENLIPNATYTLWCTRAALPPVATIINLACGEPDGSENTFTTDAKGNGAIALAIPPRLDSSDERLSVFGIAYHSDGQTYGDSPGDLGRVTHTQILVPVPPPDSDAWQATPAPVAVASG